MIELNKIINKDCIEGLKELPDNCIDCCVTSPPYFGLRDYGHTEQIGLEETPELYVAKMVEVFTEVKRVLKKEGTLWLNLGDSYAAQGGKVPEQTLRQSDDFVNRGQNNGQSRKAPNGLKPKDLIGIPWMVAKALRGPFYMGKIKKEADRIWLAAMIDGEGCMFIHKRKEGQSNGQGYFRKNDSYGTGLEVANTHREIVDRCLAITGIGSICTVERESALKKRNIPLHRWNVRSNECKEIIKEIYPYLVGKKHEARLILGCPSSGIDAEKAHRGLMNLHNARPCDIDFPAPKSLYEPGFYLRQDIIWHKLNPMPESVTDRCTKAHEYIFLMSKSGKYYYDADAIKTPIADASIARLLQDVENQKGSDRVPNKTNGRMKAVSKNFDKSQGGGGSSFKNHSGHFKEDGSLICGADANKRSVWTVTTKPYSEAHFATFPEDLIVDMIKAGCTEGG